MPYYMSPIASTLNDDSSYNTFADLQVGSDGDPNGVPTSSVGDINGIENWDYNVWDASPTGGFDTSNVAISFDAGSNGSESLVVNGAAPVTYITGAIGPISSVVLEAAVQTNATASWSNVTVEFLHNGSVIETDAFSNGPRVNTVNSGASNVADQTLTVTPSTPNSNEAIVTGTMRLTSPGKNTPSPSGMFVNVFVNGANATVTGGSTGISIGNGSGD